MPHLGKRRQAVCGAGRVGDDIHGRRVVLVLVHAHDKHRRVRRRRRDDHLLGAALHVRRRLRSWSWLGRGLPKTEV